MRTIGEWLRLFLGRESPQVVDVPSLGRLEFSKGDWLSMPTAERDFMVIFESEQGNLPTSVQIEFLNDFMKNRDAIVRLAITKALHEGLFKDSKGIGVYSLIVDLDERTKSGDFVLELSYSDAAVIYVIDFERMIPVRVSSDD